MKTAIAGSIPFTGVAPPAGRTWMRMRTLVLIRWIAVAGQAATLLVVHYGLGFAFPLAPAFLVIAGSAALNLWTMVLRPKGARIEEHEAVFYLGFDTLQLAILLYLTGGLENPFALLFIAPATVSATVLSGASTIALAAFAVACVGVLSMWHLPLPWRAEGFVLPDLYLVGLWTALVVGIAFTVAYTYWVSRDARSMAAALAATQMALAREQRVSSLGALAASAAHGLGSPLGTIALAVKEMRHEVPPGGPLAADLELITGEVGRCREILAGLSQKPEAEIYGPFSRLPLSALVREAAKPYAREGIALVFEPGMPAGGGETPEPVVPRSPEIVHGLGNLIQNGVQFARSTVVVKTEWTPFEAAVDIRDNGPGFPPPILGRLGEPYLSGRRQGGDHMGLGVFIAQILLGHTGARVAFENRPGGGARATVRWNRAALEGLEEREEASHGGE